MKRDKYVGMDVQQSMTVVAVMNAAGKIVLETMVPTAASRIRELIESLSGPLHVTLEEGSQAEWLHEVIRDLVHKKTEVIFSQHLPHAGRLQIRLLRVVGQEFHRASLGRNIRDLT